MERMKKILIIIGVLLIIAIIIIGIREFLLWNEGKLDKSNPMSREEIIALLDKGATYPNYYYKTNSKCKDVINIECYVKDNIASTYIAGTSKLLSVKDYNTGLSKTYWDIDGETKEGEYIDVATMKYTQHGYDYSIIADYDTFKEEYEYLGEKDFEGRRVIIIQMNHERDSKFHSAGTRFIIDKETGIILARTDFSKTLSVTVYKKLESRIVKFEA